MRIACDVEAGLCGLLLRRSGGGAREWLGWWDSDLGMGGKGGVESSYIAGVKSNSVSF